MKVKVITSRHSHIQPGMIGKTDEPHFNLLKKEAEVEVTFVCCAPYSTEEKPQTVAMLKKEIEEYHGN